MRTLVWSLLVLSFVHAQEPKPRAGIAAWDTGKDAFDPAKKAGWTEITSGEIKGDAVVTNGRIMAVVRRQAGSIEVYSGDVARARLALNGATKVSRLALAEHGRGAVCLEAAYRTAEGAEVSAKFRLKRGEVFVEVEPGAGAARVRVEAPSRYLVLPDFFADDIVIDATKIALPATEIPSENFVLHFLGKGSSIALAVFENREQEVRLSLEGEGAGRTVTGTEIEFKQKKVWLALLEGANTWHAAEVKAGDSSKMKLDWQMPFPAQWRVDFTRTDDLNDSWEMLLQDKEGGEFVRHEWFDDWARKMGTDRKRWTTVLGRFPYPCWVEHDRQGYLQPLQKELLSFRGPVVLYPINRVKQTPPEQYTVVDVVRATLGVGPCEYILDVEGQKEKNQGINTCSVRDQFGEMWAKGEQKQKKKEIEKLLDDALTFVKHIRARIEMYVEWAKETRAYLAGQKKARPEAAAFIADMEKILAEVDARVETRKEKIRTPAYVADLNADFRKNVMDYEGPDGTERCKKYSTALTTVGDNQDELVGECRWIVKTLRQKAGLAMAMDPKVAPIAEEIRARTQKILRNPSALERPRH
jgi:hypothetical protein